MRILFCTLLLVIVAPRGSHAEELIPGVLSFDPPAFLAAGPSVPARTNSVSGRREVWRYAATDNDPRASQRLLVISLRETDAASEATNAAPTPSDPAFRAEMQAAMNATRNVTNVAPVTDAEVAGQPALRVTCQIPRPYWQEPDGALFSSEIYWVKIRTNEVVEIKLIADSTDHLQTLEACLPKFKFNRTD
jgi:hypothetical protein